MFAEDKEIVAMSNLRDSLEANDLTRFEKTIRNKQNRIQDEPFLMMYITPLRRRMQEQALLSLLKPFRRVSLAHLATELTLTVSEIERILVDLIRDERLAAKIDQLKGTIAMEAPPSQNDKLMASLDVLASNMQHLVHFEGARGGM